jgi:hypothetical protein
VVLIWCYLDRLILVTEDREEDRERGREGDEEDDGREKERGEERERGEGVCMAMRVDAALLVPKQCYEGVTRVFQGCYKSQSVTRVLQGKKRDIPGELSEW